MLLPERFSSTSSPLHSSPRFGFCLGIRVVWHIPLLIYFLLPACVLFVRLVRFVNLRFIVEEGASLIFDMPVTRVGPNSGVSARRT